MTKPKAQTLQQKLGFFDDDLKKPKHDELMIWLDKNIKEIVNNLFNKPYEEEEIYKIKKKTSEKCQLIIDYYERKMNSLKMELKSSESEEDILIFLHQTRSKEEVQKSITETEKTIEFLQKFILNIIIPDKPEITNIDKKWELPVTTTNYSNKYTIGFIDYAASFKIPKIELAGYYHENEIGTNEEYHKVDIEKFGLNYSFADQTIFIEVKTEIKSLGELIRQINHYKNYLKGDYYVLCPENNHKETLIEQGIKIIEYK